MTALDADLGLDGADPRVRARRGRRRPGQPAAGLDRHRRRAARAQRHGLGHQLDLPPGRHRHRDRRPRRRLPAPASPAPRQPRAGRQRAGAARCCRAAHGQLATLLSPAKSGASRARCARRRGRRSITPIASVSPTPSRRSPPIAAMIALVGRGAGVRARARRATSSPASTPASPASEPAGARRAERGQPPRQGAPAGERGLVARTGEHRQARVARVGGIVAERLHSEKPSRACCGTSAGARSCRTGPPRRAGLGRRRTRRSGCAMRRSLGPAARPRWRWPTCAIIVAHTTMNTFYRLLGFLRPYRRGLTTSWVLASRAMVMTVALPVPHRRAPWKRSAGRAHAQHHGSRCATTSATCCCCSRSRSSPRCSCAGG